MRTLCVLLALCIPAISIAGELSYKRKDATWRSPTLHERQTVLNTVGWLIKHADTCPANQVARAREHLEAVGLALADHTIDGHRILVVQEGEEAFGAGMLAVRCGEASPVVLQAPHPFYDKHTGTFVREWFLSGTSRAAMWATLHRYKSSKDEVRAAEVHPADVTREPGSLFHAMTVSLARTDPELHIVQVHGYANASESTYQAVLSTGDRRHALTALGDNLQTLIGRVGVYGVHKVRLAGTKNVQARALASERGRFVHVELSATAREAMLEDDDLRAKVGRILQGGPW